jgi:hypothetical protein
MPAIVSAEAIVLKVPKGGNEKICSPIAIDQRKPFDMYAAFLYTARPEG